MKKIFVEVYRGHSLAICESQDGIPQGMMKVSGIIGVVDMKTRNGRLYTKDDTVKHLSIMSERIEVDGDVLGELEHPTTMNINYNNISHKILKVWLDESTGYVHGEFLLMDTPKGLIAQSIVRSKTPLHASSRALGDVDKNGTVRLEYLGTYDLVGTPGVKKTNMTQVFESFDEQNNLIYESYQIDISDMKDNSKEINDLKEQISQLKTQLESMQEQFKKNVVLENFADSAQDVQDYLEKTLSEKYISKSQFYFELEKKAKTILTVAEQWVKTVFAPDFAMKFENWVLEEYSQDLGNWLKTEFVGDLGKHLQTWVLEHTKENGDRTQTWLKEEFLPTLAEGLENYLIKEHAPVTEKYILGIMNKAQKWMDTEFRADLKAENINSLVRKTANGVQEWCETDFANELTEYFDKRYSHLQVAESKKTKKEVVENEEIAKMKALFAEAKNNDNSNQIVESEEEKQGGIAYKKRKHFGNAPKWLRNIPDHLVEQFIALPNDQKDMIHRKAMVYVLESDLVIEKWWSDLVSQSNLFTITEDKKQNHGEPSKQIIERLSKLNWML